MNTSHWRLAFAAAAFALAGCSPALRPDLPPTDKDPVAAATQTSWADAPAVDWPSNRWWDSFGDVELSRVVERAMAANPDLAIARAHAREAAASAAAAGAALAPTVNGSATLTRERLSTNGLFPPPFGGSTFTTGEVAASLSWKLDVFGVERTRIAARRADASAAALDAEYVQVATAAGAARIYFELAAALADRAVVESTLAQRQAVLRITESRVRGGLDNLAALREAEAQVPALEVERAACDERIAVARAGLAALLGEGPDAVVALTPARTEVPGWGVPADVRLALLARRADVAAARARVESAAGDATAARRDWLPNLNLAAMLGLNALQPSLLFNGSSREWSAGPAIGLPIFDAGRRRDLAHGREAAYDAARAGYERTVLNAVRDVTESIARLKSAALQARAAGAALEAERAAYHLAERRYETGIGTLLEVLVVQDRVLGLERQVAMLDTRTRSLRVDLIEALGGGWPSAGASS
ncbi:MAG: efflux transporter outer membrane subunit [Proteobacteria bacterium]|nr:efflux transporter outer membrane subunit [Pseudomonadota bacterium]